MVVSTDSTTPVAAGGSLKEEVLVASIGANATVEHEVSNNLIRGMDLTVVDDLAAPKSDNGDLVEACQTRIARWEDIVPLEKFVAEGAPQPRPKRVFFSIQRHRRRRPCRRKVCPRSGETEKDEIKRSHRNLNSWEDVLEPSYRCSNRRLLHAIGKTAPSRIPAQCLRQLLHDAHDRLCQLLNTA